MTAAGANGSLVATTKHALRPALNAYGLTVTNLVAQACMAAAMAIAARQLGPETLGRFLVLLGVTLSATSILDFGCNAFAVRRLAAKESEDADIAAEIWGKTLITVIALAPLVSGAALWVGASVRDAGAAILFGGVLQHSQAVQAQLRARFAMWQATLAILLDKGLALCSVLAALALGQFSEFTLWLSLLLGTLSAAAAGAILVGERLDLFHPRNPYQAVKSFGITSIATGLQPLDVAIVGFAGGPHIAGIYGAVSRWIAPLMLLPAMLGQLEAPHMAAAQNHQIAWRRFLRAVPLMLPSFALCALILLQADFIVELILGRAYSAAVAPLRCLVLAVMLGSFGQLLLSFLQGRHREKTVAQIFATAVAAQMGLLFIAARFFGPTAAALCATFTQVTISLLMFKAARRLVKANANELR